MYQIGEFSLITRLSVKTLRYYHETGLLVPDYVDDESGYRYYRKSAVERADVVTFLRTMEFPLSEIKLILESYKEDEDVLQFLSRQRERIGQRLDSYKTMKANLDLLIASIERKNNMKKIINSEIQEKILDEMIFAGVRFKGKYDDMGKCFSAVGRLAGKYINGNALALYYDAEYRENDADIEAGFPLKKRIVKEGISCRVLESCKALTKIHYGPYETLGSSYEALFAYIEKNRIKTKLPGREVYLKGPGMIFRGNPDKYITEIQIMLE